MPLHQAVAALVDRFSAERGEYHKGHCNETQTRIDYVKPAEKAKHDKMVHLVERMLTLHKDKAAARLATEKNVMQQQIEATDTQIDRLVYDLYGLTEDEIKVVEGAG